MKKKVNTKYGPKILFHNDDGSIRDCPYNHSKFSFAWNIRVKFVPKFKESYLCCWEGVLHAEGLLASLLSLIGLLVPMIPAIFVLLIIYNDYMFAIEKRKSNILYKKCQKKFKKKYGYDWNE